MKRLSWILAFAWILSAQTKDISGTWIAKVQGPMGEMEVVYRLKVENSKISGSQTLPFGDAPIVGGQVEGNRFEFIVEMDVFGKKQQLPVKGQIVGDDLSLTPAFPGPPPGAPPPAGGGFQPGPVLAHRGTPATSFRAPAVDYGTLAKIALPAVHDLSYNGLAATPPMGWNSWNKFQTKIDDSTVRGIADAMAVSGMKDAGYSYVIIDDGWQWKRDEAGVLLPNPGFPDMKALSDYVHSKGLKFGIYSSPGPRTCAGYEGSYGHEEIDAKTWAAWGVDYLKYDWCSAGRVWKDPDMRPVYQIMSEAIRKTGRPIVFALCQYGRDKVEAWGPAVGGNLWRTTGDIRDRWESMEKIGFSQGDLAPYAKPGGWNDPDMLEIGNGGMSKTEYETHLSLWAMIAAPLIAGNDIRAMTPETKEVLLNAEVIAIDQDPLGKAGSRIALSGATEVWARPLSGGAYAVALFNRGASPAAVSLKWADLKITAKPKVRDLWTHTDSQSSNTQGFSADVAPHGVVMIRVVP